MLLRQSASAQSFREDLNIVTQSPVGYGSSTTPQNQGVASGSILNRVAESGPLPVPTTSPIPQSRHCVDVRGLLRVVAEQTAERCHRPLSALHARGPYQLHDLIQGLLVHMVVVGLPISFSVRRFAK
jgi:hypothetical protein